MAGSREIGSRHSKNRQPAAERACGSAKPSRSHGLAASWVGAGWGVGRPIASRFSTGRCCHLRSSSTGGRGEPEDDCRFGGEGEREGGSGQRGVRSRVGLRYATLRTTLRYVCFFGQNYDTELRYVIYCYVTELRYLLINAANYFIVLRYAICHHPLPSGNG